jgi:beta-galactosidase
MYRNIILFILFIVCALNAQARNRTLFNDGWLFCLGDTASMAASDYDDSGWRRLDVPHDWAIEGDFSASNKSGASGGALPGGVGWYRKHFSAAVMQASDRLFIDFDGVYMNATVFINGHELGTRPYGYSSFEYDLTPYCKRQGDNVIAVRVDNSKQPNSRWYSGCGIYRNVWLTRTNDLHIAHWGTSVVTDGKGNITVNVELVDEERQGAHPMVRNTVTDADGRVVARTENGRVTQHLRVNHPHLWSPSEPYVYRVKTEIIVNGKTVDEVETTTGFRSFRFDAKTGFWLNGKNMKLNGVCLHHDLGCLGAAFNEDAQHRLLVRLKAMGTNAIRCTHNPPAPELLNMCDTMGFIVMDECFDVWREKKTQYDYASFFDKWFERDLSDMVLRDRNHPSIMMWSIGNEVLEQWNHVSTSNLSLEDANLILNAGHGKENLSSDTTLNFNQRLARRLADIVRKLDTTRPITAGCNEPSPDNNLFKSGALDLIGFNYHRQWVKDVPKNFPGKPFLFTESVSSLQTRGYYRMPSDSIFIMPERWDVPYTDPSMMCSAYDNSHASWSSTHEETWDIVKHNPFVAGQFIWTGVDYIGEPTPYGFPARSSYFGIIDLAGFPKDVYYMYQSEWTDKPVLHLFPHWNWLPGQTVDMWCYYGQADEVELFVNGKSQGVRSKADHQYHVAWRVAYEPGEVKAVARRGGKTVAEQTIRTAGAPQRLSLTMDYEGKNTCFIQADVVDKDGNPCPWAEDNIFFSVDGGTIIGADNGSQFSMERFKPILDSNSNAASGNTSGSTHFQRKAFFGKALLVVAKGPSERPITVKAQSPMLQSATITF